MRNPIITCLLLLLGSYRLASCAGDRASTPLTGEFAPNRPMPTEGITDTAQITFDEVHFWIEKELFNVVGFANNLDNNWNQIWVKLILLDGNGKELNINGQPYAIIPTMSDAVPPRGRSSFFANIPLNKISGNPVNCRLESAGTLKMEAGPILIATEVSGVRMLVHQEGSDQPKEVGWSNRLAISNPLKVPSNHPCFEAVVYGMDGKIWYARTYDTVADSTIVSQEPPGPIPPEGKKTVGFNLSYAELPQALKDSLIATIHFQCFERRPKPENSEKK